MHTPYRYRMNVSFATRISKEELKEAREITENELPGYRKFLRKINSNDDSLSIEICMPLSDGKGVMSILLSLAAEYIRLHYGSEIKYSKWVLDPRNAPDPDEDNFVNFSGKILPRIGLRKRKNASRDNIGLISLPEGMEPYIKSIVCG